jgi:hypothetical protein
VTDTVVEALILDLLQWLARRERSYEEVMEHGAVTLIDLLPWRA